MEISDIQKEGAEFVNPLFSCMTLARRAVTIAAWIVVDIGMTTVFTPVGIETKSITATCSYVIEGLKPTGIR